VSAGQKVRKRVASAKRNITGQILEPQQDHTAREKGSAVANKKAALRKKVTTS